MPKATGINNIRANVIVNLIRTLTLTTLSFLTFPYVTRALGDQVFGLYTWANTFVYYFLILAKISIPNIAIRECAKVRNDRVALSKKAQEFFLLQAVMTLISFGLLCSLAYTVPSLRESNGLIFLLSINFLSGVFSFEWIYIALEKHFYITVRSILLMAVSALMTFLFIKPSATPMNEVYIYAAIAISSTVLTSVINIMILPRYITLRKTQKYDFKPLFKPLVILFLISFALTLYNQTDEFILGFLDPTKAAVGSYSVGVKGIDIVITLTTSLFAVFMPRATYYYEKENKQFYRNLLNFSFNITFFIAVPAIATMAALATPIVALISGTDASQYQNANLVLVILSIMMLTYSLCDDIYTQILLPQKKEKLYFFTMAIGVALNIGLSLLFAMLIFPETPVIGVAIATGGTDIIVFLILVALSKQYAIAPIFNWNNLKIVCFGIGIGLFSFFVGPLIFNVLPWRGDDIWLSYLAELLIIVGIDAVIYVVGLILTKENLVSSFLPKARKRREEQENA